MSRCLYRNVSIIHDIATFEPVRLVREDVVDDLGIRGVCT